MYCPKCDMDFVEGVTVCSDCGSTLVDKDEYFRGLAEQKAREEAEKAAAAAEAERQLSSVEEGTILKLGEDGSVEPLTEEELKLLEERRKLLREMREEPAVYVNQEEKYNDNKSSAAAFLIVGGLITAVLAGALAGFLKLPAVFDTAIFRIVMGVVGVGFIAIGIISKKNADALKGGIDAEKNKRAEVIKWFLEEHTPESIDAAVDALGRNEISDEERALLRLAYIQDELMTHFDITDKSFADDMSEEIYQKVFE